MFSKVNVFTCVGGRRKIIKTNSFDVIKFKGKIGSKVPVALSNHNQQQQRRNMRSLLLDLSRFLKMKSNLIEIRAVPLH